MIDLSSALPASGILESGQSTIGRTVTIATGGGQRLSFVPGIVAGTVPDTAPAFTSTPPTTAQVGQAFVYQAAATDAEGQDVVFNLLTAPDGMTINNLTGRISWTSPAGAAALTSVIVQVFDTRGALTLQRFTLDVAGGNRAPTFISPPVVGEGAEGTLFRFQLTATDADLYTLTYWADGLPGGASFDPVTRVFSWLADYRSAGTHAVRFYVTDGQERSEIVVDIRVAERNQPPQVVVPASRTAQEGDVIQFRIQASADSDRELTFNSDGLPFRGHSQSFQRTVRMGTGLYSGRHLCCAVHRQRRRDRGALRDHHHRAAEQCPGAVLSA